MKTSKCITRSGSTFKWHHRHGLLGWLVVLGLLVSAKVVEAGGGQVVGWGSGYPITNMPGDLTNVIAIAAGYEHAVALRDDSTVVAWGYGSGKNVPAGLSNVVAVSAGYGYSLALMRDGTLTFWGVNNDVKNALPENLRDVVAVSAGYKHCLALKSDGSVVAWGENMFGCCDVPADLTNAVAVAAGHSQSLALRPDGTVVFWGYGKSTMTPPAGLTNVTAIAIGTVTGGSVETTHCLALLKDGSVVAWGDNDWHKAEVPRDLPKAVAIAAGKNHSLALTEDYRVIAWGYDGNGQCTPPLGLSAVSAIAAAANYSLAIVKILPPVISGQPQSRLANTGDTVTFVAAGNGTPPLTWQWYFNGEPVPWGTGPSLTITNLTLGNCGAYHVVLSNPYGQATSAVATLAIRALNLQMVAGLTVENPQGTRITVEWSEDLQNWQTLTNLVLPYSPYRFVDWQSAERPHRYYRIKP
ncbi:MAG: immunoglobulin domain-containing protein [Verrucomicrobiia bacterium]